MPKIDLPTATYSKLEDLARERGVTVAKLTQRLIAAALKKERELGYRSSIQGHKPGLMPKDLLREPGPKAEGAASTLMEMRRKRA